MSTIIDIELTRIARAGEAPVHTVRVARVVADRFVTSARTAVRVASIIEKEQGVVSATTLRRLIQAGGHTYDRVLALVNEAEED